jgi:NNP family nitrate/nitrite transporter-like MFS transporter
MGLIFIALTKNKKPEGVGRTLAGSLKPLENSGVWRFGLFYFLVFGFFVAFSQWLVPYFVNVYAQSLIAAGFFAALFSLPSGGVRALGGWIADKINPVRLLYLVIGLSAFLSLLLMVPKMEVQTPGQGIMASAAGTVTEVNDSSIKVNDKKYNLTPRKTDGSYSDNVVLVWPKKEVWQEPVVEVGDHVSKKQLIAKGTSRIYFQANRIIFIVLVILIGTIWGIGSATIYKLIPIHFPKEVGAVGGMIGMLGALGGFFGPLLFGYLLVGTGLWTSSWIFIFLLSLICLAWLISSSLRSKSPAA